MIDSHVHFWNFDPIRDNWITEDMGIIRNDFMPKDISKTYSKIDVTGCVAVQANQSETETEFLLDLASQNSIIKGIVGWTDLKANNLTERLNHWKQFPLIKGWRHVLQAEQDDFILDDQFAKGVKTLNEFGYTYDLLCYHTQLNAINKLVDKLPNQSLVLDHCGKPDVKTQDLKTWDENIKILAQNPNVYCKISGLLTEADWFKWTETEIFNCFDVIFKHFGTNRIMYGSDWPVVLVSRPYTDWFNLVNKYVSQFTEEEKMKIFEGNAAKFYKI
ncbi:amidohydrolase family protein [Pedobacter frigiditerrae]|uniref:amidohydrolase family protein n=1 Tax=Pedobacter frigiditerrae TaxID=2530452 RepID=UPI0029306D89|nr:amidohydrolase family protein [Pedobacter frigiditerrae]